MDGIPQQLAAGVGAERGPAVEAGAADGALGDPELVIAAALADAAVLFYQGVAEDAAAAAAAAVAAAAAHAEEVAVTVAAAAAASAAAAEAAVAALAAATAAAEEQAALADEALEAQAALDAEDIARDSSNQRATEYTKHGTVAFYAERGRSYLQSPPSSAFTLQGMPALVRTAVSSLLKRLSPYR